MPDVAIDRWPDPPDHGLATAGLLEHDLLAGSLIVEDGRMRAPRRAGSGGLGIVLDERALERFRVEAIGSAAVTTPTVSPSLADSARLAAARTRPAARLAVVDGTDPLDVGASSTARADAVGRGPRSTRVSAPGDRVALLARAVRGGGRGPARDRPGRGGRGAARRRA